jgi:MFS family permease
MMIGTGLGGLLLGNARANRQQVDWLFLGSAAISSVALMCAVMATRGHLRPQRTRRHPPMWYLLKKYNPGLILIVSVATGMGLNLPQVFLRPYMVDLHVTEGVAFFFNVYPPVAFFTRIVMRRVPDRYGIQPMIAIGLVSVVIGTMLFLIVTKTWLLILPALFLGVAHASLFPAVVAGASGAFPGRYRGLGTTLVLSMFDIGVFIGSPLAGIVLDRAGGWGLSPYPTMFSVISGLLMLCGVVYFGFSRKTPERRGV